MERKITIDDKDRVIIPCGMTSKLMKMQLREVTRLASPKSQWKNKFKEAVSGDNSPQSIIEELQGLLDSNSPTSIPYMSNISGNFLINPCPVSLSTFNKMNDTDEVINRCISQNVNTISQGVGEYHHPNPKCQEVVRYAMQMMGGVSAVTELVSSSSIVNGMFTGYIDPHSMEYTKYGYLPTRIIHLPEISVQFSADAGGSLNGVYQYVYNFPYAGTQNALSTGVSPGGFLDGGNIAAFTLDRFASLGPMDYPFRTNFMQMFGLVELDMRYFLHFSDSVQKTGINPYGTSWLLPVYNVWIMKQLSRELYVSAQSRVAHPLLVGYASHTARIEIPSPDSDVETSMSAVEALYAALASHTEDSALILTGRKGEVMEVEAIHPEADFSVFEKALDYYDKRLESGLKVPGGSYDSNQSFAGLTAQSSIYMRMMSKYRRAIVRDVLINQFARFIIHNNVDENIREYGDFDSEIMDIDDRLKTIKLYAQMVESGFISNLCPSTIRMVGKQMGIPELDEEEMQLLIKGNFFKMIIGKNKKKKDTTGKENLNSTADHYKEQPLESQYQTAKGS